MSDLSSNMSLVVSEVVSRVVIKRCIKCGADKPTTQFPSLQWSCNECFNPEEEIVEPEPLPHIPLSEEIMSNTVRRCTRCEQDQDISLFVDDPYLCVDCYQVDAMKRAEEVHQEEPVAGSTKVRKCQDCGERKDPIHFGDDEWHCEACVLARDHSVTHARRRALLGSPKATERRMKARTLAHQAKTPITSSQRFEDICQTSFEEMDKDGAGYLEKVDAHAAILLVFTKILPLIPLAHIPSPDEVADTVEDVDFDESGLLDYDEFRALSFILCRRVVRRQHLENAFLYVLGPLMCFILILSLDFNFVAPEYFPTTLVDLFIPFRNVMITTVVLGLLVPKALRHIARHRDAEAIKSTKDKTN